MRFFRGSELSVLLTYALLSGCFVNSGPGRGSSSSSSTTNLPAPGGTDYSFTLSQVVQDSVNPTTVLDLIDSGQGQIGNACNSLSGGSTSGYMGGSSATCGCTYSYTTPQGDNEQVDVPFLYQEQDLAECLYTTIPAGVTQFTVQIHVDPPGESYSSPITFSFSGASGGLDPSQASSFAQVTRFQCRDIVTIYHLLDPGASSNPMYDPVQSDDSNINYPLDFFTTNMGASLADYAVSSASWNCPAVPNDPNAGLAPRIYSLNAGPNSPTAPFDIFPVGAGDEDRFDFFVASQPAGVFTVPLNTYMAPTVPSNPSVGYAAAPVGTPGTETCPTTAIIPPGFVWKKLWLFRADLAARNYLTSSPMQNVLQAVSCNPGNFPGEATAVYPECGNGPGDNTQDAIAPGSLADRILGTGGCVAVNLPGSDGNGVDIWDVTTPTAPLPAQCPPSTGGSPADPVDVCAAPHDPHDSAPTLATLTDSGGGPETGRFDFLFVVSPITVTLNDFNTEDALSMDYTPYRFFTSADCNVNNPSGCNSSLAIRYNVKLHDMTTNGDPPAGDPNQPGVYPMCVLSKGP